VPPAPLVGYPVLLLAFVPPFVRYNRLVSAEGLVLLDFDNNRFAVANLKAPPSSSTMWRARQG